MMGISLREGRKMKIHVYGNITNEKVVLLHPMYFDGEGMAKIFQGLAKDYFIISPDFSGHGSETNVKYNSLSEEIQEIRKYLKENKINQVTMLYGASMGARAALELISYDDVEYKAVYLDGTPAYDKAPFLESMLMFFYGIGKLIPNKLAKAIMKKTKGKKIGSRFAHSYCNLSLREINQMVHDCYTFDFRPLSEITQKRILFDYGSKEIDKKCIPKLKSAYPYANYNVRENLDHCHYLFYNSKDLEEDIKIMIKKSQL